MYIRYATGPTDHLDRRAYSLRRSSAGDPAIALTVVDPAGEQDHVVGEGIARMSETGLADTTVRAYRRGALKFHTHYWHKLASATSTLAFTPWAPPGDVRELLMELLRALGARLEESADEKDVWHIKIDEDGEADLDEVVGIVCGTFHLYTAYRAAGLYTDPHPFEVPLEDRVISHVPVEGANDNDGRKGPTIRPRFRLRLPLGAAPALRMETSKFLPQIIPALIAFGTPPSIVMMFKTMVEGLARITEQINLTVWDWWTASRFGDSVQTTNKGRGKRRTKLQDFSPEHVVELLVFFDTERRLLDPEGWGVSEWREYLEDETKTKKERRAKAMKAPLFPNARKTFHTRSGVVDQWYRPAMKANGLPTRTHYIRHCGVNSFLAFIRRRTDLTPEEKGAERLQFARDMGWAWPLVMLARYSGPERHTARVEARREWRAERRVNLELLEGGLGSVAEDEEPAPKPASGPSRLVRIAMTGSRAA